MLIYIIQTIIFQLLFLVVYDLFLKKETFFNWNRVYLLLTAVVSLVLPFVKLQSFKTTVSEDFVFLLSEVTLVAGEHSQSRDQFSILPNLNALQWVLLVGSSLSFIWLAYKFYQIRRIRQSGKLHYFNDYTRVEVPNKEVAFSFFNSIYIGSHILQRRHHHIINHELVHVRQGHSWDLLLFEILRILFWFNPLIYFYQNRIAELHEFIADSKSVKNQKKEYCQYLLQDTFQTEQISFVNQFFNHSLIKKRIVMLQKSTSKKVWKLKYLLLIPLLSIMLFYTSCEAEGDQEYNQKAVSLEDQIRELEATLEGQAPSPELQRRLVNIAAKANKVNLSDSVNVDVPFTLVDVKPSFKTPCTEGTSDFNCFKVKLDKHVRESFEYPKEAITNKIQGRVYVNFRINTDGTVKILNSRAPSPILDAEAKRIIESLPVFNPGQDADGNPVPVSFAYPIVFRL